MGTGKRQAKRAFAVLSLIFVLSQTYNSYGDTYPPRPSKAVWADEPAATGPYTIRMRVADACDANDMPCQYLFTCTNDATKSSAWQSSTIYEASGLTPKTTYTFNVKARDSAVPPNTNTASYNASATTDDNSTPPVLRLDLNNSANNDDANTQPSFLPFILENSGREINGVIIDLSSSIASARRQDPCGTSSEYQIGGLGGNPSNDPLWYSPRSGERIYRDFIYGINPSGVTITLWGLGVGQDCNIMIWAYDACSIGDVNIVSNWYANGIHVFDTNFIGGSAGWPKYLNQSSTSYLDLYKYAWQARVTADNFGRIALTSARGPSSPADKPFAFVNALKVEPNKAITFVPTTYAYRPQPASGGTACVPVNTVLKWKNGSGVVTQDLYLGTNSTDVTNATRASHPNVLIYTPDQPPEANQGYDPLDTNGFLALDTTYYWRVDENDNPTVYKGEVWNFTTCPNSVVDNFDSYGYGIALNDIWTDGGTGAEVSVETVIVRSGKSMRYVSLNYSYEPYYSEVRAAIGTGYGKLNIDPDWLGMGAKSLSLWFYGQAGNDFTKPMYVKLTDGNNVTGYVAYDGDMNDIRRESWHEWNIALHDFVDNNGVNLSNVKTITIGFGTPGVPSSSDGTVFFDDIQLYTSRCVLAKRSADFAKVDYAPLDILSSPGGDCKVDYQELAIMEEYWLDVWDPGWIPPSDYVAYWPMNEGAGNKIYTDPCNPLYTGTLSPSGVAWATPGEPGWGGAHALYFDGYQGTRVSCGNADLGIGPTPPDVNAMTLSIWVKWSGPRLEPYLYTKPEGLISKAGGWTDTDMIFMFEIINNSYMSVNGSFGLRHYITSSHDVPDLYAPTGILTPFVGQWIHLAATYPHPSGNPADANSYAKLYLNGVEVASGPWRFSHGDPCATDLTIGNNWGGAFWPDSPESFYGYLDEARIYKRVLTASEISYMAGREPPCDLYSEPCPECFLECGCPQVVNFKDYDVLMNYWLTEELWP